ncbi:MAG: hypothetical protein WDZ94_04020 [Patescibacteria group bacterium]
MSNPHQQQSQHPGQTQTNQHPIGHHAPRPDAPHPQQQHPYTHSSHTYHVTEEVNAKKESAFFAFFEHHRVLIPLIALLAIVVSIFFAMQYSQTIGSQVTRWLGFTPNTQSSEVGVNQEFSFPDTGIIFSSNQLTLVYSSVDQNITEVFSPSFTQLSNQSSIQSNPTKTHFLLSDYQLNTLELYDSQSGNAIKISDQLKNLYTNFQILDSQIHQREEAIVALALIKIEELNVPITLLVEYNAQTKQLKDARLNTGENPKIIWIHPTNNAVYLTSYISNTVELLTTVDQRQRQTNTRLPYTFLGKSSPQGLQIVEDGQNLTITQIFNPTQTQSSLAIDQSAGKILETIWHQDGNRVSVLLEQGRSKKILTFSLSGQLNCESANLDFIDYVVAQHTNQVALLFEENRTQLLDLATCQNNSLFSYSDLPITKLLGWY